MKNFITASITVVLLASACDGFLFSPESHPAEMRLKVSDEGKIKTRVSQDLPDTNDFHLEIRDSYGELIYEGPYGAAPEVFEISAGSYEIDFYSIPFGEPAFSAPQYGDSKIVIVNSEEATLVELNCSQLNSGVRIVADKRFRQIFPEGYFFLNSADGSLNFPFEEERTAFFKPGVLEVYLQNGDSKIHLADRELAPKEMLLLRITLPEDASGTEGLKFSMDSSRNWTRCDLPYCPEHFYPDGYGCVCFPKCSANKWSMG